MRSRSNTRLTWPGVVFLALLCCMDAGAASLKATNTFTLELPEQSRDTALRGPSGLQYVRPGVVAVWYTEKNQGGLSRRDRLDSSDPWQLRLQLVNTANGEVQQQMFWPTRKNSSGLAVQRDNYSLLLTGPVVHCLTPDFRETESFSLKYGGQPKEERVVRGSPGGKIIWLVEASESASTVAVDPSTCKPLWRVEEPRSVPSLTGNDEQLVDANARQIGIWSRESGWKQLYKSDCCLTVAAFLAPNLVGAIRVVYGMERHFIVVNLQGKLLMDDVLDPGMEFGSFVTSADGRTAGVIQSERDLADLETGVEVRRVRARIRLYNLSEYKKIGMIDVSAPGENLFGIAIGTDSKEFAVLNGNKLSIYPLRH